MALAVVALELLVSGRYGYFREELYALACSEQLAWGYVDHPPLSIALLAGVRAVLGDSLLALRLLPALSLGLVVLLVGAMTRELGGGRRAVGLAGVAVALAPTYLEFAHVWIPSAFDLLFWALGSWLLIRLLRAPSRLRWLGLGLVVGLGTLNKLSLLWFGFGLALGLLATPQRALLRDRGPALAAGLAALLLLPYLRWQLAHDWPTLELLAAAPAQRISLVAPLAFVRDLVVALNPVAALVWLAGLGGLLLAPGLERFRAIGASSLVVALLLVINQTVRTEYLVPAFLPLFAAGGVVWERLGQGRRGRVGAPACLALLVASGALLAPRALPLLSPEQYLRYAAVWSRSPAPPAEAAELPPFFADMHGWDEIAALVVSAYASLPPADQARAVIVASNYGEAAAIDLFGRRYGLPPASSWHNNYWLWGLRGGSGEVLVGLIDPRRARSWYRDVRPFGEIECRHCLPYERGRRVFIGRDPQRPLAELWPSLKRYR